ncbi:MAG: tRNA (N6-isopentenyl adenosine(37)-C2)-methylthiotransferase MiaB [Candidatus Omnitrophota bacterium]
MNDHDSKRVKDLLLEEGYSFISESDEADILIFNTCSVRKHAEDRVFNVVHNLKKLKKKRKDLIVGIIGCMAEAKKDEIFKKLPIVDFLCGPADLDKIPSILRCLINGSGRIMHIGGHKDKKIPKFTEYAEPGDSTFVKIMEGCSNFCSYCIVPYVRGPERSRPYKDILKDIKKLCDKGVKKIILLGQNVNSYGKGLKEDTNFPELLERIDKIVDGKAEILFVTSHPKDAGTTLFRTMAKLKSISKELHLPIQSGSNRILKKMNRGYTVERYKKLAKEYRSIVKNGKLSTDLIIGFPGETKKDFLDTLKIVKEIKFNAAYIFKYSPRPYTKASKLKDNVLTKEKERRHAILLENQREISKNRNIKS